jgi:redox-regulated HSP33 family molecular chaperone
LSFVKITPCSLPELAALPRAQAFGKASKALGKAFAERSSRQSALRKIRSAKTSLPRAVYRALGKVFAESLTLGKAGNKKIRKKTLIFFIGGGAHRQVVAFFAQNSRLRGRRDLNS